MLIFLHHYYHRIEKINKIVGLYLFKFIEEIDWNRNIRFTFYESKIVRNKFSHGRDGVFATQGILKNHLIIRLNHFRNEYSYSFPIPFQNLIRFLSFFSSPFSLILPFHFPFLFHFYSSSSFLPRITFPLYPLLHDTIPQFPFPSPLPFPRLLSPFLSIDRVHRVSSSLFPASLFPKTISQPNRKLDASLQIVVSEARLRGFSIQMAAICSKW